jgi:phosphoadenosine phosphosulfate reductase
MLVSSHRHRLGDMELWRELEEADVVFGQRLLRSGRIERSLEAIHQFIASGPAYVGVSWGKESVCTAHLVRSVDIAIPIINLRCTNRNPDCDAVRDAYLSTFPSDHREVVVDYENFHSRGLPHQELNKLTDKAWHAAIRVSGKAFNGRHILGIRAAESGGRKMRCHIWGENSPNGCAPLTWWSIEDVFGYLSHFNLPIHPAYAMIGGGRWPRERLRVAEIGDTHGTGSGRAEWEREFYGDVLNRLAKRLP